MVSDTLTKIGENNYAKIKSHKMAYILRDFSFSILL